jgi:hypothetical protein
MGENNDSIKYSPLGARVQFIEDYPPQKPWCFNGERGILVLNTHRCLAKRFTLEKCDDDESKQPNP